MQYTGLQKHEKLWSKRINHTATNSIAPCVERLGFPSPETLKGSSMLWQS